MPTYIALLRGINVSGQKLIKMTDLKELFEALGFQNVQTYIQSGNVIFSSKEKSLDKLESIISTAIRKKFGFDAVVIVITPEVLEYILENNPFIKKIMAIERLYVTFLSDTPSEENINKLGAINYSPEEYIIDQKIIYLHFPNGAGKVKLSNNLFESKLKVDATTRNLKTINKLWELSNKS
ncbi:MAG: DUF1697 domain-containing protein [Ignavibacterium sp.]|nr:DUF1697 domain-containing protein [Ignavibacterium sp.]